MATAVVQLHPLADDAALALLRVEAFTSAADFGRRVGWNRQKAARRLKEWSAAGHLQIEKKHGKIAVTPAVTACPPAVRVSVPVSAPSGTGGTESWTPLENKEKKSGHAGRVIAAVLCCLIGVTIASFTVAVNGTSWAGFVRGVQGWYIVYGFVAMGVTISIAVMILPAVIRLAPGDVRLTLWALFIFLFLVDVLTQVGFAYGNFGSAVAGTAASVNQRAYQEAAIHRLRREQQAMDGKFIPTSREAAEAATQARQRACSSATYCKAAEAKEAAILKDRGLTVRAEDIAAELKEAEGKLESLPVTASVDPLTEGLIDLVFQTTGHKLESRGVTTGRNVVFALFLLVPAGFFRSAASLARR